MNIDESIHLVEDLDKEFKKELWKETAKDGREVSAKIASLRRSICDINYVITELYARKGMITHAGNKTR